MKSHYKQSDVVQERRYLWASVIVVSVLGLLWLRVWHLQIYKGDYYRRVSENNRIRKIEIPAPRGMMFDAHGKIVLGNVPSSDLVVVPQYTSDMPKTLEILGRLMHRDPSSYERRVRASRSQPRFMPITLQRNLDQHEISLIETNRVFLPGVEVRTTARREYLDYLSPHIVGHLGEISPNSIDEMNQSNKGGPYQLGDLIGKQGLESRWEMYLRGKRGYRVIQVDAFGRTSAQLGRGGEEWNLPHVDAVPGASLELTLDLELQKSIHEAFAGKNGAVIALDPRTGAVLGLTSNPGWDPYMYQRGLTVEEFRALTLDPFHPFIDKTTGGEFAPGSTYKAVIALAALEEKVVTPQTSFNCTGSFQLGTQRFGCHKRTGHGSVSLRKAMAQSCDVYFYQVGIELGVNRIAKYAFALGLGGKLGFDVNVERPGLVPTEEWKQRVHKESWLAGETPSISIGQGYNLVTPLQMASLFSVIANEGTVWKPYLVKRVIDHRGIELVKTTPFKIKSAEIISKSSFKLVKDALEAVVMDDDGTGKNARVKDIRVAGKTGSVQVVNLKKNNKQVDVSVKWKEHAMFASYAPANDPEIVVIVVSEHDEVGGGGASAAPVAGKVLNRYFDLRKIRAAETAYNDK